MPRTEKPEVPLIDRQNTPDAQAFGHRRNGAIDKIDAAVGVLLQYICRASQVLWCRLLQFQFAPRDRLLEIYLHRIAQLWQYHICLLRQYYIRQQWAWLLRKDFDASRVQSIVCIENRQQKPRVQQGAPSPRLQPSRCSAPCAKTSSTRRDKSGVPLWPMPMKEYLFSAEASGT